MYHSECEFERGQNVCECESVCVCKWGISDEVFALEPTLRYIYAHTEVTKLLLQHTNL